MLKKWSSNLLVLGLLALVVLVACQFASGVQVRAPRGCGQAWEITKGLVCFVMALAHSAVVDCGGQGGRAGERLLAQEPNKRRAREPAIAA